MHQAVSTIIVTGILATSASAVAQEATTEWLAGIEQQAQLPATPTPWTITEWPDLQRSAYTRQDGHQHGEIDIHHAPADYRPYDNSHELNLRMVVHTRQHLANPDIWPTFLVKEKDQNWIDTTREYVHDTATGPVVWFDNFFALKRSNTEEAASHDLRITPKLSCRNQDGCKHDVRIRSRVTLPHTQQRLRLLLTNEDPNSIYDTLDRRRTLPDDQTDNPFSAALSYAVRMTDNYDIRLSSGVQGGGTPQVFIQAGSSGRMELTPNVLVSAGQSFFYRTAEGWGARTQLDFDTTLRQQVNEVIRVRQTLDVSEDFIGANYDASVEYLHQVNRNRAWGVGVSTSLNHLSNFDDEGHRLWYRYRKRFYREWLFWEIQPFIAWTREYDFKADPGLALSIEIYLDEES